MGIFNRKKKDKQQGLVDSQQVRSIIKEYYGDDVSRFIYTYASSMYNIPEVRIAIETFADIFATIPIYHKIVNKKGETTYLDDDISYVLGMKANNLQNATQFKKSLIIQLMNNNNAFAEPEYDSDGYLKAIYPLPLKDFEFELQENNAYVKFYDAPKGSSFKKYNLKDLIYLNRFPALDGGKSHNLGLYETVVQALSNQILKVTAPKKAKALLQGNIGGVGQLKPQDKKGTMNDLKASFDETVEGIAYVDPQWKITPINWQENDVNRDLMSFVINVVYNYFGMTDSIINDKASEIEREMFIARAIKPLAQQAQEEFTTKLFTPKEIMAGHRIELDTFALSVSTVASKTALFNVASRNGILNIDEMREYLGQSQLSDGLGKKYRVSADCIDLSIADKYQLGKVSQEVVSTEKPEDIKNKEDKSGTDKQTK